MVKDKSGIPSIHLPSLLQRVKVSPDEFYRLTSNYNSTPIHEFITSLTPAFINDDVHLLNQKLDELDETKYKIDSLFYNHYKILLNHFINYINKTPINKNDTDTIISYLIANDNWGSYEVYLYTNFIKFIPLDINNLLIKTAKKSAAHYVNKDRYKHAVVVIQLNYINELINKREILLARKLIDDLIVELVNTKYFYEINKLQYLKGKAMIADGKIYEGKKIAQKAIDTMYQLNNDALGRSHQKDLNEFIISLEFKLKENFQHKESL